MNDITLTIDPEAGNVLLESLNWSLQATERTLQNNPNNLKAHDKWDIVSDLLEQIQTAKQGWYGATVDCS